MNSRAPGIIIALWCLLTSSAWPQEHSGLPIEVRTPTTDVAAAPAQESEAEASDLTPADEEKEGSKKKDPSQRLRVLSVPTVISEPAIGYGLGVGIGFIHPTKESDAVEAPPIDSSQGLLKGRAGQKKPPRITGIGLAYTDKETWAAGVAHFQHWKDDSIRYVGAVAYADVKATMYLRDTPFDTSRSDTPGDPKEPCHP